MGGIGEQTDFLVPASSFVVGMGSVMNISGNYFEYNESRTPNEADIRALRSDWYNVGKDISDALDEECAELGEPVLA